MLEQQRASLEERMARLEGMMASIDRRLDTLERRPDTLDSRMDNGLRELRLRQDRLFWMIFAILLPMWVTIILAIVFKA